MSTVVLLGILAVCLVAFIAIAVVLELPLPGGKQSSKSNIKSNIRNIVASQRQPDGPTGGSGKRTSQSVYDVASQNETRTVSAKLTLDKKLKYAQWKLPTLAFRGLEVAISLIVFSYASLRLNYPMQALSLLTGPLFMRWLLNLAVDKRFRLFDADYPQFLLSLVGLLKTGMNPLQAIEAASAGLEESSLVRLEVELMMERLRFGVPEEKSIGSFGEDIMHPEIELFVQALLLSKGVGGNLSDTLDRLARQVRKRQYFRKSANAAIGMQRGSIWFIIAILVGLELYLYMAYPSFVVGAWADPVGWQVWQTGIVVILLGIFWVRQVTKLKI